MMVLIFCLGLISGCAVYGDGQTARLQEQIQDIRKQASSQEAALAKLDQQVERLNTAQERLRRETAERLMDLELSLEPVSNAPGPAPDEQEYSFKALADASESQPIPEELKKKPESEQKTQAAPAKANTAETDDQTAQGVYRKALDLYYEGKAEQAREVFSTLIREYPSSSLLPNAWYWMGETYYMEKNYPQAILTFRQVLEKFPESSKAPGVLLKIGYSYEALKDFRNAMFYLGILVQDYPEADVASKAQEKLRQLKSKT
ncbi:MAG: tol-pal system protein YbgF [Desulfonatronovibrionaceae bacterium]